MWQYACVHTEVRAWRQQRIQQPPHLSLSTTRLHKVPHFSTDLPLVRGFSQVSWTVCPASPFKTNLLHQTVSMSQINPFNTFFRLFLIEDTSFFCLKRRCYKYTFTSSYYSPCLATASSESVEFLSVDVKGQPHSSGPYGSQPKCANSSPRSPRMLTHSLPSAWSWTVRGKKFS